ncbi:hypothetical protein AC1031_004870 [Aphanomyces cochlioides]|nr:hypothetical protein AC1031_004870 [Aphanomyces cochlioides]
MNIWKCEILNEDEWTSTDLFVATLRDAENGRYRLIGEGEDSVAKFDLCGAWQDDFIQMIKIYAKHNDFQITIPMFACFKCDAVLPIQNELCLNCAFDIPEWKPLKGSPLRVSGQSCSVWSGLNMVRDEFEVEVFRDLANNSYRIAGFDKNKTSYFALNGTWKDNHIHLERYFLVGTTKMDGTYDVDTSEWSGTSEIDDEEGTCFTMDMRYIIPTWRFIECYKPVVIENTLCFSCDKTPRETIAPIDLPFLIDDVRSQLMSRIQISKILNQRDRLGRTALMYAAEKGNLPILVEILSFLGSDDVGTIDQVLIKVIHVNDTGLL